MRLKHLYLVSLFLVQEGTDNNRDNFTASKRLIYIVANRKCNLISLGKEIIADKITKIEAN